MNDVQVRRLAAEGRRFMKLPEGEIPEVTMERREILVCGCDDLLCPDCHPMRVKQERQDEQYEIERGR